MTEHAHTPDSPETRRAAALLAEHVAILDERPPSSREVRELIDTNREVVAALAAIETKIDAATTELGPIVSKLSNHPMLKMFGGK